MLTRGGLSTNQRTIGFPFAFNTIYGISLSHFQLFVKVNLRFIQGLLELDVDILKLDRSVLTLEVVWCTMIKCTYII